MKRGGEELNTGNRQIVPSDALLPDQAQPPVYGYPAPAPEQIELSRVFDVLRRRFWIMAATFLVVLASGIAYTLRQKPVYEASAMMLVATTQPASANPNDVGVTSDVAALTRARSVQSQIELLTSPDVLRETSRNIGDDPLASGYGMPFLPGWAISAGAKKDTDVITVSAKAYDPEVAATVANTLVSTYIDKDKIMSSEASRQGRMDVSKELDSVNKQLFVARKNLADYKRKTKLVASDAQLNAIASNAIALQIEMDKAKVELASAQKSEQALGKQLQEQGQEIALQLSPGYQEAVSTLAKLNTQKATLLHDYAPGSQQLEKMDSAIAETKKVLERTAHSMTSNKLQAQNPIVGSYLSSVVSTAAVTARLKAVAKVADKRYSEIDRLPEQERLMTQLMSKVAVLERNYQMLSDKYYTLFVNEKSTLPSARFASMAYPSALPVAPDKKKNVALFSLLGIMISVGVATLAERLDKRVRYEDLVLQLTGQEPISSIPNLKGAERANLHLESATRDSSFAESFKILRNVLVFGNAEKPPKMIAVTSPGRAEGKSTTSVNLAAAAAIAGKRVLVIDCDLRRPSLHKRTSTDRTVGFTSLVRGQATLDEVIKATSIPKLFCLPSGPLPLDPAGFLNSAPCRETFELLASKFDWVVIDCPPCAGISDMQIISTVSDAVLLVVSLNLTHTDDLRESVKMLSLVNAPYAGSVINRLNVKRSKYDYYKRLEDIDSETVAEMAGAEVEAEAESE